MRKQLFASLSACLVTASFVGCGDKSQEAQVSEQLDKLLDQMSLLQYADAPIKGNKLEYTLGKDVDGVKVPGSTRFEAAYLDQALALLPLAEDIEAKGSAQQKESANAIIGSVRTDEAAFLIDQAERSFQSNAKQVGDLRRKLSVLREIQAVNNAVAGDRSEVIETYQTGLRQGGVEVIGINTMQEQASAAAGVASEASQDLSEAQSQIEELRNKVSEYEALELQLTGQARSSQSSDKFDKLDQATAAAKEAETAQAQAQKLEIDAWIAERIANLAEFKRSRLAGQPGTDGSQLLGKLEGFIQAASQETNIPSSSDVYAAVADMLNQSKAASGNDTAKAAAFMMSLSSFGSGAAVDQDERSRFVAAIDILIIDEIGVIGVLEMKIEQIKLERQRVADKLAEIDRDRQEVLTDFASKFAEYDAKVQVAGFGQMIAAIDSLELAEAAVKESGKSNEMELMSVYVLHARALQQMSVSARLYKTSLDAMAAAGPDLLGDVHSTLAARSQEMQDILDSLGTQASELQAAASTPSASLLNLDPESDRGQIATAQMDVYQSLIDSLSGNAAPAPSADDSDDSDVEPAAE